MTSPAFLVYELFAHSKILFQGPQPLHFYDLLMKRHKHILLTKACHAIFVQYFDFLALSHIGQELWLD